MLRELSIRNLAVIENVTVQFGQGFHAFTGETGAGKSMVVDALSLLAGARGSTDMIRHGCEKADLEAVFDLPPEHPVWAVLERLGIEADPAEALLVRRELSRQGKSAARINGQNVTLAMLREVGDCLIDIHGQHEHQALLRTERHLEWLDAFAGRELAGLKEEYGRQWDAYQETIRERRRLESDVRQQMQMLDLYRFQLEEIEKARLKPGEDESLADERRKLMHAEKLAESVAEAHDLLYGSKGLAALSKAVSLLEEVAAIDPAAFRPLVEQLQSAYYAVEDAAFQLRDYRDRLEFDPDRLAQIERRLDALHALKRKYGDTVEDILAYRDRIREEMDRLENRDERLRELAEAEESLRENLTGLAERLSALRRDAAARLSEEIVRELAELNMPRSVFEVRMERTELGPSGADAAEFLLSTNPGEPPKPLAKIASGGEMSRVMLALKTVFARLDQIPVLVFDEVDAGISGRTAQAVAEKLTRLAGACQVLAVTHLPQVACMADRQYAIRKDVREDGRTVTVVRELSESERVEELARLLGGVEVTEKTRHHAQEMLMLAHRQKYA
ncbi:MAG TPA: DNA repair protein RecN [Paenibacillaceae bacterium]